MTGRFQFSWLAILPLSGLLALGACDSNSSSEVEEDDEMMGAPVAQIVSSHSSVPENDGNQTVVRLDGSGSSDPDGETLTYNWSVPGGTFVNGTTATDAIIQVTFPGASPYTVELTVTDENGLTGSATFTVGVDVY